jgi:hypothetical protein
VSPLEVVLEGPGVGDLAVVDAVEVDFGDVGESPACGWVSLPGASVGGGACEPADDQSPSAISSTVSMWTSGNDARNDAIH